MSTFGRLRTIGFQPNAVTGETSYEGKELLRE